MEKRSDHCSKKQTVSSTKHKIIPRSRCVNLDDPVTSVRVRSVWCVHGAVAAPLSLITGLVGGQSCKHYWVEIVTYKGAHYCAHFTSNRVLSLSKHRTSKQITNQFLPKNKHIMEKCSKVFDSKKIEYFHAVAYNINIKNKKRNRDRKSLKDIYDYDFAKGNLKTIGDVIDFMENCNGEYNMLFNNCQHFAMKLFKWF